jgi:hypothetical protein
MYLCISKFSSDTPSIYRIMFQLDHKLFIPDTFEFTIYYHKNAKDFTTRDLVIRIPDLLRAAGTNPCGRPHHFLIWH